MNQNNLVLIVLMNTKNNTKMEGSSKKIVQRCVCAQRFVTHANPRYIGVHKCTTPMRGCHVDENRTAQIWRWSYGYSSNHRTWEACHETRETQEICLGEEAFYLQRSPWSEPLRCVSEALMHTSEVLWWVQNLDFWESASDASETLRETWCSSKADLSF